MRATIYVYWGELRLWEIHGCIKLMRETKSKDLWDIRDRGEGTTSSSDPHTVMDAKR